MTDGEQKEGASSPENASSPERKSSAETHSRPLRTPQPDDSLFETPSRLPRTRVKSAATRKPEQSRPRPKTAPHKPRAEPSSPKAVPSERVTFPVAKPPPGTPPTPPAATPPVKLRPATTPAAEETQAPLAATVVIDEVARRSTLFGYVLYLALAVGTLPLPGDTRYLVLWLVLLALGAAMLLFDEDRPLGATDPLPLVWGLGIGFVLGLPLMLTASNALARTSLALVPVANLPALFQALVLTWPLGETLFYRGVVQREYGLASAALAAGLGNLVLYWPESGGVFAVLLVATSFSTALAFVYGYVRLRYGLAAAYSCQVMTNLMLLFLPRILVPGV